MAASTTDTRQDRADRLALFNYLLFKGAPNETGALTYPCPTCADPDEPDTRCQVCRGRGAIDLRTRARIDASEIYREQMEATRVVRS